MAVLILIGLITLGRARASRSNSVDTWVNRFSRHDAAVADIAIGIASELSIPVGFEGIPEDPERKVSIEVKNTTARSLFDALVREDPRYKWTETDDGLVNIYPKNKREQIFGSTTVPKFRIDGKKRTAALDQLMKVHSFESMLSGINVTIRTPISGAPTAAASGPDIFLNLRSATIRTILDEILLKSGGRAWSAVRYGNRLQYLSLSMG